MAISKAISRLRDYQKRHGLTATFRRGAVAIKRALFSNRTVVFYCDLGKRISVPENIPNSLKIERLKSYSELSPRDLERMTCFWNPKQADRNIRERFEQGASVWLIKLADKLAGFGWTMTGGTIEPHYFPLTQKDVHLFDFHVFPEYRGQGLNPFLVTHILSSMSNECGGRAYIEAAEWNEAQLASLRKISFQRMGWAKKWTVLHRTIVCWAPNKSARQAQIKE